MLHRSYAFSPADKQKVKDYALKKMAKDVMGLEEQGRGDFKG